jgi:LPXTG-motif cell wall-anchored protein
MKPSLIARTISAAAICLVTLGIGTAASASDYDNTDAIEVSRDTAIPGMDIEIVLRGFKANTDVTIIMYSDPVTLGTFRSDAEGVVRAKVTLPKDVELGKHSIEASGVAPDGTPFSASAEITLAATLPDTGSNLGLLIVLGGGAAVLGAGMIVSRRRTAN